MDTGRIKTSSAGGCCKSKTTIFGPLGSGAGGGDTMVNMNAKVELEIDQVEFTDKSADWNIEVKDGETPFSKSLDFVLPEPSFTIGDVTNGPDPEVILNKDTTDAAYTFDFTIPHGETPSFTASHEVVTDPNDIGVELQPDQVDDTKYNLHFKLTEAGTASDIIMEAGVIEWVEEEDDEKIEVTLTNTSPEGVKTYSISIYLYNKDDGDNPDPPENKEEWEAEVEKFTHLKDEWGVDLEETENVPIDPTPILPPYFKDVSNLKFTLPVPKFNKSDDSTSTTLISDIGVDVNQIGENCEYDLLFSMPKVEMIEEVDLTIGSEVSAKLNQTEGRMEWGLELNLPEINIDESVTVTEVEEGSAAANFVRTDYKYKLSLDIPKGEKGDDGEKGDKGDKGDGVEVDEDGNVKLPENSGACKKFKVKNCDEEEEEKQQNSQMSSGGGAGVAALAAGLAAGIAALAAGVAGLFAGLLAGLLGALIGALGAAGAAAFASIGALGGAIGAIVGGAAGAAGGITAIASMVGSFGSGAGQSSALNTSDPLDPDYDPDKAGKPNESDERVSTDIRDIFLPYVADVDDEGNPHDPLDPKPGDDTYPRPSFGLNSDPDNGTFFTLGSDGDMHIVNQDNNHTGFWASRLYSSLLNNIPIPFFTYLQWYKHKNSSIPFIKSGDDDEYSNLELTSDDRFRYDTSHSNPDRHFLGVPRINTDRINSFASTTNNLQVTNISRQDSAIDEYVNILGPLKLHGMPLGDDPDPQVLYLNEVDNEVRSRSIIDLITDAAQAVVDGMTNLVVTNLTVNENIEVIGESDFQGDVSVVNLLVNGNLEVEGDSNFKSIHIQNDPGFNSSIVMNQSDTNKKNEIYLINDAKDSSSLIHQTPWNTTGDARNFQIWHKPKNPEDGMYFAVGDATDDSMLDPDGKFIKEVPYQVRIREDNVSLFKPLSLNDSPVIKDTATQLVIDSNNIVRKHDPFNYNDIIAKEMGDRRIFKEFFSDYFINDVDTSVGDVEFSDVITNDNHWHMESVTADTSIGGWNIHDKLVIFSDDANDDYNFISRSRIPTVSNRINFITGLEYYAKFRCVNPCKLALIIAPIDTNNFNNYGELIFDFDYRATTFSLKYNKFEGGSSVPSASGTLITFHSEFIDLNTEYTVIMKYDGDRISVMIEGGEPTPTQYSDPFNPNDYYLTGSSLYSKIGYASNLSATAYIDHIVMINT